MDPDSWKGYNIAFAASGAPGAQFGRWRLDDEVLAYPTYEIIYANKHRLKKHPGFFNICIHKGLSANGTQPGGPNNIPQFGNPDDLVKAAVGLAAVQFHHLPLVHPALVLGAAVLAGHQEPAGSDATDDADRPRWTHRSQHPLVDAVRADRRGQVRRGREPTSASPSSRHPLPNIYAELGTTMASMIVTFPTVWAHLIGQLLYYMGDENIVFGSDSLWYGGAAVADRRALAVPDPRGPSPAMALSGADPGGEAEHPRPEQRPALWPEDVVAQEPLRPGQAGGLRGPYAVGERHRQPA